MDKAAFKYAVQKYSVYPGQALNLGKINNIPSGPFPFNRGYYKMNLIFEIAVVIGTGTGAKSEGELAFIPNIFMRTDKHGPIVDNVCGRALYRRAHKLAGTPPAKDAIAAADGTYRVNIPIDFANIRMRRPEDTLLDTNGVKSLDLMITMGSLSDLFTSVGTAAVTVNLIIEIEATKGPVDKGNGPVFQPYLAQIASIDPAIAQYIEVTKIPDLGILDLMLFATNSATAGSPWSGTPSDTTLSKISYHDDTERVYDNINARSIQNDNKLDFSLETSIPGLYILNFSKDRSVWSSLPVGGKAKSQPKWENGTLSTSMVSGLIDGVVTLK